MLADILASSLSARNAKYRNIVNKLVSRSLIAHEITHNRKPAHAFGGLSGSFSIGKPKNARLAATLARLP